MFQFVKCEAIFNRKKKSFRTVAPKENSPSPLPQLKTNSNPTNPNPKQGRQGQSIVLGARKLSEYHSKNGHKYCTI